MTTITVAQTLTKMNMASADKKAIITLFNALVGDLDTLRAKQAAMGAKLDNDAGVTDTNYAATTTVAAGGLVVGK